MATEVRLPQWSMGMSEGTVVAWYHKVGDHVAADDPIAEVEAEKTTDQVISPVDGTILQILVKEGDTIPVRTVLALVGDPRDAPDVAVPTAPEAPPPAPAASEAATARGPKAGAQQVTPVARRLAKELGVDLDAVEGTGPRGRVTEGDVRRFAESPSAAPAGAADGEAVARSVPLAGMRGFIARRMHESLQSMAQLTLTREVDVTALVERSAAEEAGLNALFLKAVVAALVRHPELNATLEGETITVHPGVQLGMAIALDDGLIVAVVRDAEHKSLSEIAADARSLAEKARAGTVTPGEVSGSTFTVTNLGAYGIDAFTPIINPPEVAILGVGRIRETLVRQGQTMAWRKAATFSLTIDHRAIDGVTGARFLDTVARTLAEPARLWP